MSLRISSRAFPIILACASSTGLPHVARAQQRLAGVIDGLVTDTGLTRLAGASISLIGTKLQVITGANGRFAIVDLPPGKYTLYVRRVGYSPVFAPVEVVGGDTLRGSYALQRVPPILDTVLVTAPTVASSRLTDFDQRRKLGQGSFFTSEDIQKANPIGLSDLFRRLPSLTVAGTVGSRRLGQACPLQFFVDGVAVPTPKSLDRELPSPRDLAGIEVYANTANIPLQYKTFGGDNASNRGGGFCGVVLLWTKDGSD